MKEWETIADKLKKCGWSLGWVSAVDSEGRRIWIVDAHRNDEKRYVVRADEQLSAFLELQRITHEIAASALLSRVGEHQQAPTQEFSVQLLTAWTTRARQHYGNWRLSRLSLPQERAEQQNAQSDGETLH